MKRSAEDPEHSSSSSSSQEKEAVKERKKRKVEKNHNNNLSEEKLMKKYMKKVAAADQTMPDENVEAMVKSRIPASMKMFMREFNVNQNSHFMKLLPEDNIIKIVTSIVIKGINEPVRQLIYTHLPHYKQLESVVEKRQLVQKSTITIAEELKQLDPPGADEPPYSEFVELLHGVMTNIIKRVAGVIEGNELLSGNSMFTNALLSQISSQINLRHSTKTRICTYLFNEICTFAGEVLYTFFMDDKVLIKRIVNKNIST
uniref:Wsv310-like protein n=1 Tax=Metopaulias depressus WSSV-like virus TaxID=1675544 RepID=A0A0K0VLU4_9VIRU|nr:wsv310-like protein [Metopaulias depressus WSSV-like virus]